MENPPAWSLLSEKALRGILNRAKKRKERLKKDGLPGCLTTAINGMIEWWQNQYPGGGFYKTLKERAGKPGGGKGLLVTDNLSATLATHQDQAVFIEAFCDDGREQSRALVARMDGSPMIDKGPSIAIQATRRVKTANKTEPGVSEDGTMFTLTARDRHMVLTGAFTAGQGAKAGTCGFSETIAPTLKADGGLTMMPSVVMERQNK